MMTCNGKCHLKQLVKTAEKQEKKQPFVFQKQQVDFLFPIHRETISFDITSLTSQQIETYLLKDNQEFYLSIFHPPA